MADNIQDFMLRYRPFGRPGCHALVILSSLQFAPLIPQRRICDETTTHDLFLVFGSLRHNSGCTIG